MGEQRNLFLAVGIAIAILLSYNVFISAPAARQQAAQRAAQQAEQIENTIGSPAAPAAPETLIAPTREAALETGDRIEVRSPEIVGSIALTGALIDDVSLTNYTRELDPESGIVTVLNPARSADAYFALQGWTGSGAAAEGLPDRDTPWRLIEGDVLTPSTPVKLAYDSPAGVSFVRTIEIDDHFMFTVTDAVTNRTGAAIELRHYAEVERRGIPTLAGGPVHEGLVGMFNNSLETKGYKQLQREREGQGVQRRSTGGWLGITDKYWLAAVIPHPNAALDGEFTVAPVGGTPIFHARWTMDPEAIPNGEGREYRSYVFAGAKRAELLRDYETTLGIHRLNDAIDWGWMFWFLTKPFFFVLEFFFQLTHNFGLAILLLVVVLKAFTFPLANISFKSMARLKALQPKQQEIKERFKADPQRQQKEMMALFQREKVNPLAGCLPLLVQIPVFWALYKTLFVTIEMRHAPFFGWIQDLSARDPTNVWNLFGLIPFDPGAIPILGWVIGVPDSIGAFSLAIGVLPLLYGLTMAAMQTLNPPAPDPMQQRIFTLMPWIFMFIMAPFAAGLLIYWIWNNILSFFQQYIIMRRQGVDTPIGTFLSKRYVALRARMANGGPPPGGSSGGGPTEGG